MPDFAVSPEKNQWLKQRMSELDIREQDIVEKFVRSSGKGGQKVNKTATCVYLKHVPTGLEVKCMKDRSQSINRFLARRELVQEIEIRLGLKTSGTAELERVRKQKARRKRRTRARSSSQTENAAPEK